MLDGSSEPYAYGLSKENNKAVDVSKCLDGVKLPLFLHFRASCFQQPTDMITME